MLVERVNRYLNMGLKIMMNKGGLVQVAMEAILLLLYAWNSAPIPGTDLLHCFVALGQEFQFPIDFSSKKHFKLTSPRTTIASYSRDLATHLSTLRGVAELLVKEQRAYHCEHIHLHCLIQRFIWLVILCLHVGQSNQMQHVGKWIS